MSNRPQLQTIEAGNSMISQYERTTKRRLVFFALLAPMAVAWSQGVPIDDEDLAGVWGQAMFSVVLDDANTKNPLDLTGPAFNTTRITLNADVKLNANLTNIQFGKPASGLADLDIAQMRFVSSGTNGVNPYVKLTDPYMEFVYKNQTSTDVSQREIIGMRLGFAAIDGNIGLQLNGLKGNIKFDQGTVDAVSQQLGALTLNSATRATSFTCGAVCATLPVGQVGSVSASGSTDFFISMLSQGVNFSDGKGGTIAAPDGFALNWTQGVSYTNTTGAILANPLPPLKTRQGG